MTIDGINGIKAYVDGKTKKAIEILTRAKRANPKDYRIFWILGKAYESNKQYKEAIESYLKTIEVKAINPNPEYIYWEWEKYRNAESPDGDYMIWWYLGRVYILDNKFDEAVDSYLKAIELYPYHNEGHDYGRTLDYYHTIREKDIIKELADLYFNNGKYSKAINFYSKCGEVSQLAEAYELNGQFEEAIKILNYGNRRNGNYGYSIELAELYCRYGKYKEAIDCLSSMSKSSSFIRENNIYYCLIGWKDKYKIESLYKEAIDYLTKIIETESAKIVETKPNDSLSSLIFGLLGVTNDAKSNESYKLYFIWGLLGISYFMNGQYKEAIDSLLKSTELEHENNIIWNLLGVSYYRIEQREDAKEAFLTAEALGGDKDFCQFMLGKLDSSLKNEELKDDIILKMLKKIVEKNNI